MNLQIVHSPSAPAAIGPYSQAIRAGNLVFCSGQIALDPQTMQMVGSTVARQAEQVMKNLLAIVAAAGHTSAEIVRCTIFLKDLGHFGLVNAVYEAALEGHRPARATVEVSRLPRDVLVEIDAICVGEG